MLRLPAGSTRIYLPSVPAGWQRPSGLNKDIPVFDIRPDDGALQKLEFELLRAK